MIIKLMIRKSTTRKRPKDLRRLLRYLFTPQLSRTPLPSPPRLLGPPQVHSLIQRHLPWGLSMELAADDLANQMAMHSRHAFRSQIFPAVWYAHIVMSFAPAASELLSNPVDDRPYPPKTRTQAGNALRICYDALDSLGWDPHIRPSVHVVHGDRRHIHVHSVIALASFRGVVWEIHRVGRRVMIDYGEACRQGFQLPKVGKTAALHLRRWADF
jgi:hypothetical protein